MLFRSLSVVAACAALVACGGGGGGGVSVINGVTKMSGSVIDGYIENATVCLDVNNNLSCDSTEPSAKTDKDGKYTISYDGDISGKHIIAVVTAESKDADDGGKTLAEAGKEAFFMAAPAAKPEAVTPLTTLVTHAMLADTTIKSDEAGFKKAEDIVKANTGIQVALLSNDFVKKSDTNAQDLAKVITVALGDMNKEVKASVEQKKTTDANFAQETSSDNGQKTIQQNIVRAVSAQVAASVTADGVLLKSVSTTIAENKAATANIVSGQINNIVVATKSGASSVADAKTIIASGLVIAGSDSGRLKDGVTRYSDNLQVQFMKIDMSAKTIYQSDKILYISPSNATSWQERYDWGRNYVMGTSGEWVYDPDITSGSSITDGSAVFDQNCMTLRTDASKVNADDVICLTQKNISGKKIKDLIDGFCNDEAKKAFPNCDKEAVFSEDSYAYDITLGVSNDRYRNQISNDWTGYNTTDDKKTVEAFIDASLKNTGWLGQDCNIGFMVKSYDPVAKKGVMLWSDESKFTCDNAYTNTFKSVEETAFEVKTVGETQMMVLDIASIYNKNNQNEGIGQKFIFNYMYDASIKKGGFFQGTLTLKNTKRQLDFNGDTKLGNKGVLDSYLKGLGMTPYPYPTSPTAVGK
jgi:hypothetical protein